VLGYLSDAAQSYQAMLEAARKSGDRRAEAEAYLGLGRTYLLDGGASAAIDSCEHAMGIVSSLGDDMMMLDVHIAFAQIYTSQSRWGDAIRHLEKAIEMCNASLHPAKYSTILNEIGLCHAKRSNYGVAIRYHKEAAKYAEKAEDAPRRLGNIFNNIGWMYAELKNLDLALEYFDKSVAQKERVGDRLGVARTKRNIAEVYYHFGSFGKALEINKEVLNEVKALGNVQEEAATAGNLAQIYRELAEYGNALQLVDNAYSLAVRAEHPEWETRCQMIRGSILACLHAFSEAKSELLKAIARARQLALAEIEVCGRAYLAMLLTDANEISDAKLHLEEALKLCEGRVYLYKMTVLRVQAMMHIVAGELEQAEKACENLHAIADECNSQINLGWYRLLVGWVAALKGRSEHAELMLSQALSIARKLGARELEWRALKLLGDVCLDDMYRRLEYYNKALKVIEEIASNVGDESLKESYLSSPSRKELFVAVEGVTMS